MFEALVAVAGVDGGCGVAEEVVVVMALLLGVEVVAAAGS